MANQTVTLIVLPTATLPAGGLFSAGVVVVGLAVGTDVPAVCPVAAGGDVPCTDTFSKIAESVA